jgi:hypothetical protein
MSNDFRKQMYDSLNLKETDELAEIWKANDRVEWSEMAFDVIQEILQQRLGELPAQNEPVYEHLEQGLSENDENPLWDKFTNKDNAPEFYKPQEVLWMYTWLKRVSTAAVVITIIVSLPEFIRLQSIVKTFFLFNPAGDFIAWAITIVIDSLATAFQCFIVFFSLRALASILKILMEMEFNSRGVK